ncbi:hypothetical protein RJ639_026402, partial [Escallonia herrerae]
MATFLRRLAKTAPVAFPHAFRGQSKSSFTSYRVPFGAIAAISGGFSYLYYFDSPSLLKFIFINLGHLDQINEETGPKVALNPDKWIEFKLEDRANVSHNADLYRFSFDPSAKLGLDVASCLITRAPSGQDAEGKMKYVIRPYTPISDPDSKGFFDLLIKVYPEGKMSQHFASLKPGDVVEFKGPIEKLRYHPNMKKEIGM